jgi:hypothetical protein
MLDYLLIFICVGCYTLGHAFAAIALLTRLAGRNANEPYLFHAVEKMVSLFGLIFLSIFTPVLAYITEIIFSTPNFIFLVIISQASAFFVVGAVFLYRKIFYKFLFGLANAYRKSTHIWVALWGLKNTKVEGIESSEKGDGFALNFMFVGFISNIFLASGFFLAFYFASLYPQYRLSISQTAVVINGIGMSIQVLYGDPALARYLKLETDSKLWKNFSSYYFGRLAAHVTVIFIFIIIYAMRT